ncbi:hypothetical protein DLAC_01748 [Tieghemostelium lacteum]|uniref:Uncharacterized protein n=1 Tax=Tieghemostelium lacteum TaxID=361077 RepID=A0A152A689_TIELA|nr:hypothetical protein DLAC_01748 [Tieghemostelium lacteum]|eukprot:KYR01738.1 hypothetical protein DLAC_01748 [Tieghemostelium lacteum]
MNLLSFSQETLNFIYKIFPHIDPTGSKTIATLFKNIKHVHLFIGEFILWVEDESNPVEENLYYCQDIASQLCHWDVMLFIQKFRHWVIQYQYNSNSIKSDENDSVSRPELLLRLVSSQGINGVGYFYHNGFIQKILESNCEKAISNILISMKLRNIFTMPQSREPKLGPLIYNDSILPMKPFLKVINIYKDNREKVELVYYILLDMISNSKSLLSHHSIAVILSIISMEPLENEKIMSLILIVKYLVFVVFDKLSDSELQLLKDYYLLALPVLVKYSENPNPEHNAMATGMLSKYQAPIAYPYFADKDRVALCDLSLLKKHFGTDVVDKLLMEYFNQWSKTKKKTTNHLIYAVYALNRVSIDSQILVDNLLEIYKTLTSLLKIENVHQIQTTATSLSTLIKKYGKLTDKETASIIDILLKIGKLFQTKLYVIGNIYGLLETLFISNRIASSKKFEKIFEIFFKEYTRLPNLNRILVTMDDQFRLIADKFQNNLLGVQHLSFQIPYNHCMDLCETVAKYYSDSHKLDQWLTIMHQSRHYGYSDGQLTILHSVYKLIKTRTSYHQWFIDLIIYSLKSEVDLSKETSFATFITESSDLLDYFIKGLSKVLLTRFAKENIPWLSDIFRNKQQLNSDRNFREFIRENIPPRHFNVFSFNTLGNILSLLHSLRDLLYFGDETKILADIAIFGLEYINLENMVYLCNLSDYFIEQCLNIPINSPQKESEKSGFIQKTPPVCTNIYPQPILDLFTSFCQRKPSFKGKLDLLISNITPNKETSQSEVVGSSEPINNVKLPDIIILYILEIICENRYYSKVKEFVEYALVSQLQFNQVRKCFVNFPMVIHADLNSYFSVGPYSLISNGLHTITYSKLHHYSDGLHFIYTATGLIIDNVFTAIIDKPLPNLEILTVDTQYIQARLIEITLDTVRYFIKHCCCNLQKVFLNLRLDASDAKKIGSVKKLINSILEFNGPTLKNMVIYCPSYYQPHVIEKDIYVKHQSKYPNFQFQIYTGKY